MKRTTNTNAVKEEQTLLNFLRQTKQGKYAEIDKDSLDYARVKEERSQVDAFTEIYYYNLS
jgi:hypothetical protein